MPNYYSQHGEDSLLFEVFADSVPGGRGYFVEVGALDGRCLSNTLCFEELGWRGLCIEAHGDYFELLQRNRPHSTCVHAAVSSSDQASCEFFANHRGALSTLDPSTEGYFREHYAPWFGGFEVQHVRRARLSTLLNEVQAPARFEFLSIDVEGHELEVLAGITGNAISPGSCCSRS